MIIISRNSSTSTPKTSLTTRSGLTLSWLKQVYVRLPVAIHTHKSYGSAGSMHEGICAVILGKGDTNQ